MRRLQAIPLRRLIPLLAAVLLAGACRGERVDAQDETTIEAMVDSLRPAVEQAVGLSFKGTPRSAMRTRDQVRTYLTVKLDEELPPARARGLETAYRLFGLLPDTLELRPLLLELLTEQVVGFYDPDSATLFGVSGVDPTQLKLVLAHEMVHALQGQHLPLDSLLHQRGSNDRLTAAQAILEGQATLASMRVLAPGQDLLANPEFWETYRDQVRSAQSSMPLFTRAPRIVREGLIFPYLGGAEFMRWWASSRPADSMPFGALMPVSTEQVLHPERYARGDRPIALRFADSAAGVLHEDALGELEIGVLAAELAGSDAPAGAVPLGWGGDRYRVYETPDGPALVWYSVWDDARSAERFRTGTGARLAARTRPGYRGEVVAADIDGRPGIRYVFAPAGWEGWGGIPMVVVR